MFETPNRFFTGITLFDQAYGHRALGGDSWLFLGQNGKGRTNFACQTAGHTAAHGRLVVYITAETDVAEIGKRAFCAATSTKFGDVAAHETAARQWEAWKNLKIVSYSKQRSDFATEYGLMLNSAHEAFGKAPDLVIVDNLNGIAPRGLPTYEENADGYSRAAAVVADTAKSLGHIAILIAQTSPNKRHTLNITGKDAYYSRSLGEKMTGVLAITSLDEEDSERNRADVRADNYLVISMCDAVKCIIPVTEQFDIVSYRD